MVDFQGTFRSFRSMCFVTLYMSKGVEGDVMWIIDAIVVHCSCGTINMPRRTSNLHWTSRSRVLVRIIWIYTLSIGTFPFPSPSLPPLPSSFSLFHPPSLPPISSHLPLITHHLHTNTKANRIQERHPRDRPRPHRRRLPHLASSRKVGG